MPFASPSLLGGTSMSAPATPSTAYSPQSLPAVDSQSSAPSSPPPSSPSPFNVKATAHVRRPKNPFILFRCDFVRRGVVPASVERDHRNISRIAGRTWRLMTPEQKRPWELLAAREKAEHARRYPDYKYKPASRAASTRAPAETKRQARRPRADDDRCEELARLAVQLREGENLKELVPDRDRGGDGFRRRRSLSCPPAPSAAPDLLSFPSETSNPAFFAPRDDVFAPEWNLGIQSGLPQDEVVGPFETAHPQQGYSVFEYPYDDGGGYLFAPVPTAPVDYIDYPGLDVNAQLPGDCVYSASSSVITRAQPYEDFTRGPAGDFGLSAPGALASHFFAFAPPSQPPADGLFATALASSTLDPLVESLPGPLVHPEQAVLDASYVPSNEVQYSLSTDLYGQGSAFLSPAGGWDVMATPSVVLSQADYMNSHEGETSATGL